MVQTSPALVRSTGAEFAKKVPAHFRFTMEFSTSPSTKEAGMSDTNKSISQEVIEEALDIRLGDNMGARAVMEAFMTPLLEEMPYLIQPMRERLVAAATLRRQELVTEDPGARAAFELRIASTEGMLAKLALS